MKTIKINIILLLILTFGSITHASEIFYISDDDNFAPFCWLNTKTKKIEGLTFDIMTEACKRLQVKMKYEVFPWKRAQMMVKVKQADALITIPTPERLQYLVPCPTPIIVVSYNIFTRKNHPKLEQMKKIKTLNDLKSYTLVDYLGDGWAKKNLKDFNIEWGPKFNNVLKMLANRKQIDLFVQSSVATNYNIKLLGLKSKLIEVPGVSFSPVSFHLLFRKDSNYIHLLPKINKTLLQMKQDGTTQKIYNKYK